LDWEILNRTRGPIINHNSPFNFILSRQDFLDRHNISKVPDKPAKSKIIEIATTPRSINVRYTGVGIGVSVPVCPAIFQKNLMMVRRKNNALLRFAEKIYW
jgi:hypothetical protein